MVDVEQAARRGRKYEWGRLTKPSALLQAKTVQWSAAKINLNIFSLRDVGVSDEESTVTNVKLFSKNHWFLWIQDNGSVVGTHEQGNEGKSATLTLYQYYSG